MLRKIFLTIPNKNSSAVRAKESVAQSLKSLFVTSCPRKNPAIAAANENQPPLQKLHAMIGRQNISAKPVRKFFLPTFLMRFLKNFFMSNHLFIEYSITSENFSVDKKFLTSARRINIMRIDFLYRVFHCKGGFEHAEVFFTAPTDDATRGGLRQQR